jgi:hypothetical protein
MMPWAVAATVVVGAYSANQQKKAGEKGADAQSDASAANIAEQRRQFDIAQENQRPFLEAGVGALGRQEQYLSGDTSGFQNSADYKFAVDQGFKGLDRGAAARGALYSGGADADRIALGQGLATQYANNYWDKLARQAGQGQASAQNLGGLGANVANQIGANNNNAAQARASQYANTANANSNFANQALGAFGQYWNNAQQAGGP